MRFLREHLEFFLIPIVLFFCIFFAIKTTASPQSFTSYENLLFDTSFVHKINLDIPEDSYNLILKNPTEKIKYLASITIDGEKIDNVSISTQGNASLFNAAASDSDRYNYKINFSRFIDDQTYHGLDRLVLNNVYSEPSLLRNYISYWLARASGAEAPLASFVELKINGELKGLYLAIEGVNKSFLRRNDNAEDSVIYKPEPLAYNNFALDRYRKTLTEEENARLDPDKLGLGGADLVFSGTEPSNYSAIFDNKVTKTSRADDERVVRAILSLSNKIDLEEYWDVDALIRYFVLQNLSGNWDSYIGAFYHNYFLKLNDGKLSIVPWDCDIMFQPTTEDFYDKSVFDDIDPATHPAWNVIKTSDEYLDRYHKVFQDFLDNYFTNHAVENELNRVWSLVEPYVDADRLGDVADSYEELINIIDRRVDSVQKELWSLK
ncbi:CotH kinase family protein [Candidatus Saccharibacteria bacterium]|nr:CotH kinase family protein [Candidatus Saccharibacteria bacterium]